MPHTCYQYFYDLPRTATTCPRGHYRMGRGRIRDLRGCLDAAVEVDPNHLARRIQDHVQLILFVGGEAAQHPPVQRLRGLAMRRPNANTQPRHLPPMVHARQKG